MLLDLSDDRNSSAVETNQEGVHARFFQGKKISRYDLYNEKI